MKTELYNFLWLDDIRNPFLSNYIKQYPNLSKLLSAIDNKGKLIWVRNFDEFISWINENGLPDFISFDHDLADEHYTPPKYWEDYQKSKEYQDSQNWKEKTGLDCAKWIVEYCMDNTEKLPEFYSHSANPVGRDNINSYLNQFKELQNK